jgi:mRNA-degrading endonuclease toxin of MazEF toxin-antitoxin module
MRYLFQGRIFWREVPNLQGDGEKVRPLVIVSSTADANNPKIPALECVACSHSTAERDPLPPRCVLLPEKVGKREAKLSGRRLRFAIGWWRWRKIRSTIETSRAALEKAC